MSDNDLTGFDCPDVSSTLSRPAVGVSGFLRCAFLACAFAFVAQPLRAQTSLQEAVVVAAERDPSITALRQQVARRAVDIQAARDERLPQFSLAGDTGTTDANGAGLTLTVSQVLYDWGMIQSRIESASQERVKAVSELKMAVEEQALVVSELYLDIEIVDRKLARTRDYLAFAQRIAEHADNRAGVGLGDSGEVARSQLEIARADERMATFSADLAVARSELQYLLGRAPGTTPAAPELNFANRYRELAAIQGAVRFSPDYIAARAEMGRAAAGVTQARAARLPTLRLQAQGRADLDGGRSRTAVGLSAGVDLNSGSYRGRQIQAAQLELEGAKSSVQGVERDLTNGARTALARLQALRASEASQTAQLQQADEVLASYEEQFIAGQRELIDLLTTARDLYDAQISEIDNYDTRRRTEYQAAYDLGALSTLIASAGAMN